MIHFAPAVAAAQNLLARASVAAAEVAAAKLCAERAGDVDASTEMDALAVDADRMVAFARRALAAAEADAEAKALEAARVQRAEVEAQILAALAEGPSPSCVALSRRVRAPRVVVGDVLDALVARRQVVRLDDGYRLDSPVARLERIKTAKSLPRMLTAERLAKAACVTVDEAREQMKPNGHFTSGPSMHST